MMKTESKQDLRDKVDMLEDEIFSLEENVARLETELKDLTERYEINKKSRIIIKICSMKRDTSPKMVLNY